MSDAFRLAAMPSNAAERAAHHPGVRLPSPPLPTAPPATLDEIETTKLPAVVADGWGRLPLFAVSAAVGSLIVTLGYHGGRIEAWWSDLAFWSGVLLLFLPITCRLAIAETPRQERIGLISLLGLGLYLNKILHSPLAFTFHDEFAHWRTTADILRTDHLFNANPIIPVSALYPSLHVVTAALADISGSTIFLAGVLVLAAARLLFVLALFLFFEQAGRSARIASLATLLYMANPNFSFFDAQFAYESIALPFAMFAMYAATRQQSVPDNRFGLTLAVLLAVAAVVPAHHLTAYALVAFLVLWMAAAVYVRVAPVAWTGRPAALSQRVRNGTANRGPSGIVLLALVISLAWLVYVAGLTVGYLTPVVWGGISELIRLIAGEVIARELFRDYSGQLAPIWERLAGFASVIFILLGLPFGLIRIWRRYRADSLALSLAVGALAYPASLGLRFTHFGAEASNRTSEFLFVPIAFVLAVAVAELWLHRPRSLMRPAIFASWAAIIFAGGIIVGMPRWARMPGPYLVSADTRSIEPKGIAAADWMRTEVGTGNRIAMDRINGLLMGSLGGQTTVRYSYEGLGLAWVFFPPKLGTTEVELLRSGRIQYVLVDHRLSSQLPVVGIYYEMGEPDTYGHIVPMDPDAIMKFDGVPGIQRIFDNGDIVIYDVGALTNAP